MKRRNFTTAALASLATPFIPCPRQQLRTIAAVDLSFGKDQTVVAVGQYDPLSYTGGFKWVNIQKIDLDTLPQ
jgi:hypothetical protein